MSHLFVALQYLIPKHWITSLVYGLTRIRLVPVKNVLIRGFCSIYAVDAAEVDGDIPNGFRTFNDFFVRKLVHGARAVDEARDSIVSPADGTISQAGKLEADKLLQAKGMHYALDDLLAADLDEARAFVGGTFATIYLAPYNYHRVHAPVDGELVTAHYVPGDLFSVNDATARRIRGLFSRNERLILHFRTMHGPVAVIFVGALNVGSISTPWTGEIRPRKSGVVEPRNLSGYSCKVGKGDLLGWFNMGSTVIVLFPQGACRLTPGIDAGATVRMGQRIATLAGIV